MCYGAPTTAPALWGETRRTSPVKTGLLPSWEEFTPADTGMHRGTGGGETGQEPRILRIAPTSSLGRKGLRMKSELAGSLW